MPAITKPSSHFNAVTYTGTGSERSITGVGFQPDFVWAKSRSNTQNHTLFNSVVGTTKYLFSNATTAETTNGETLKSFNADGYTLGTAFTNETAYTYVSWNWKAGGAAVTNTTGTISTQVSANPTAGFSVMTYTGNATNNATIGHGLGAVPKLLIWKPRDSVTDWMVWHAGLSGYNYDLRLNTTANQGTGADPLNNTAPGSSVVTLRNQGDVNGSGTTIVCYAFAEIAGYSAFGKYTGNGSSDGTFVYLGFRPKWMLIKRLATESWILVDSSRDPYNLVAKYLLANTTGAEASGVSYDFVSNGIKFRGVSQNESAATYIYAAFAESPLKYANAR